MEEKSENPLFIYENSNEYRKNVLLITLFIITTLLAVSLFFWEIIYKTASTNSVFNSLKSLTVLQFSEVSLAGLFYIGLIGGLFFVLMPIELLFYGSVVKGSNPWLAIFMIISGLLLSQLINYFLGSRLNPVFINLVSKRKVYQVRRFINKYGGYGVFLSNLTPLPSELLTFALGIAKYNIYRLFIFTFIANLIKYVLITIVALLLK